MRFARIVFTDIRYQYKYGFYFLYVAVSAAYVGILSLLPAEWLRPGTALIILSDPAALGFFFIGGMILLERGEGLHKYYSILPATPGEYVLAKAFSLSLISTIAGVVIAAFALGSNADYFFLTSGLFAGSTVFTLSGLAVGTMARSVNHYFVLSVPAGLVLTSPGFLPLLGISQPLLEIMPASLLIRILFASVGLKAPYHSAFAVAGLLLWVLPAYLLAKNRFAYYLQQGGEA